MLSKKLFNLNSTIDLHSDNQKFFKKYLIYKQKYLNLLQIGGFKENDRVIDITTHQIGTIYKIGDEYNAVGYDGKIDKHSVVVFDGEIDKHTIKNNNLKLYIEPTDKFNIKFSYYDDTKKIPDTDISNLEFYKKYGLDEGKTFVLTNGCHKTFTEGHNGTNGAVTTIMKNPLINENFFHPFLYVPNSYIVNHPDITNLDILNKDEQTVEINNSKFPAGTVIYISSLGSKSFIKGVYHINGLNLELIKEIDREGTENKIFEIIKTYYSNILTDFTRNNSIKADVIHLVPVPGHIFKGTIITECALYLAVYNFISTYKGPEFTIILGLDENKFIGAVNTSPQVGKYKEEILKIYNKYHEISIVPLSKPKYCPLSNKGINICYINSCIQLLYSIKELCDYFKTNTLVKPTKKINTRYYYVLFALQNIFNKMDNYNPGDELLDFKTINIVNDDSFINSRNIYDILMTYLNNNNDQDFIPNQPGDSNAFLNQILDAFDFLEINEVSELYKLTRETNKKCEFGNISLDINSNIVETIYIENQSIIDSSKIYSIQDDFINYNCPKTDFSVNIMKKISDPNFHFPDDDKGNLIETYNYKTSEKTKYIIFQINRIILSSDDHETDLSRIILSDEDQEIKLNTKIKRNDTIKMYNSERSEYIYCSRHQ
jgi:hypothetical protein